MGSSKWPTRGDVIHQRPDAGLGVLRVLSVVGQGRLGEVGLQGDVYDPLQAPSRESLASSWCGTPAATGSAKPTNPPAAPVTSFHAVPASRATSASVASLAAPWLNRLIPPVLLDAMLDEDWR